MQTGTALVTLDELPPKEARNLHLEVKSRGRGALTKFIKYETPYTSGQYYYRMRQKGVMPFDPKGSRSDKEENVVTFKSNRSPEVSELDALKQKIQQLEMQLEFATTTPADRALEILNAAYREIDQRSRIFLCQIIARDTNNLSVKQEKWLTDLEKRYA